MLQQYDVPSARVRHGLEVIERCARSQAQLIEDLLDVSRIVSGKMRLEVRPVMIAPVIEKPFETMRLVADAKNVNLQLVLDPEVSTVSGDAQRLQQVVWNLLSNAIKFTPKGGSVQVFLETVDSHIEIALGDTGQGIDPEFLPCMFDRFQQVDQGASRLNAGLGIGLAIVRHTVEAHGDTVHAESQAWDRVQCSRLSCHACWYAGGGRIRIHLPASRQRRRQRADSGGGAHRVCEQRGQSAATLGRFSGARRKAP
jgi:signal transduction histidine kinase